MGKLKLKIKNIYILILIFVLLFSLIVLIVLDKKATPIMMNYANVQTKKIGIEVLRNTGIKEINKNLKDKNLFVVTTNSSGEIESIDFDTMVINDTLIIVAKNVRKRLKEVEQGKKLPEEMYDDLLNKKLKKGIIYQVPFGVVFGNSFLSSLGPKIPVKIKYSGNVGLDVKTKVKKYGLDSALIEVYIYVEVTQRTILPFQTDDIKLTSEIPVVMKVVKGTIPNYLMNSNNSYNLPMD